MDDILKAVTSQLAGAIAVLVPALVALAVSWLNTSKARLEAQRQAALGAVVELEAVAAPRVPLDGPQKKELAMERLAERLPASMKADEQKLDALIEEAWQGEQRKRTSVSPPDDDLDTDPVPPPAA